MTIPTKYKPIITSAACSGKKAAEKNAYIGTLAEQLINGVNNMVIFLSRSEESVRLAITPGTLQPKPISIGTILLPDNPSLRSSLSMINATLAIYPLSSSIDKKKNNVTITGRKLSTLPTPLNMPSIINACNTELTFNAVSALSTTCVRAVIPISSISDNHAPITLKVR